MDAQENTEEEALFWHYTDWEGFTGIVRDHAIRATRLSCLNDEQEARLAVPLIVEAIAKHVKDVTGEVIGDKDRMTLEGGFNLVKPANTCVACFDKHVKGDRLSQWRGYGRSGVGVALGFDGIELEDAARALTTHNVRLAKCAYTVEEQVGLLDPVPQRIAKQWNSIKGKTMAIILTTESPNQDHLLKVAPQIKHEGFAEEQEWRLIAQPLSPREHEVEWAQYRSGSIVKSFIKLSLSLGDRLLAPLRKVVIGPGPYKIDALFAAEKILQEHMSGPHPIRLGKSAIPFRNW